MTSAFTYRDGVLHAENVSLEKIAVEVGTPFYVYSTAQLKTNYKAFVDALADLKPTVFYSVKGNTNQAVIRILADCGAGADITSIGELERSLAAGIAPGKIVFSGVGKTTKEITAALNAGIYQLNVESIPEMQLISQIAGKLKKTAPIAIRVNPDVDALTYKELSTGEEETKFGIGKAQLPEAMKLATSLPGLAFVGFTMHIGSQLTKFEPFREAYKYLADIVRHWRSQGVKIARLDLGGGVGVSYGPEDIVPPLSSYAAIMREAVGDLGCELGFEPGRVIAANAGLLVSEVIYAKKTPGKQFLILDAGMSDLVRPVMYGVRHEIITLKESGKNQLQSKWDVVGPICETGDLFGTDYVLPESKAGDRVAFLNGGWMGSVMSSYYNGRPGSPEVLVSGSQYAVVRRRIPVSEQMGWEKLAPWQDTAKSS